MLPSCPRAPIVAALLALALTLATAPAHAQPAAVAGRGPAAHRTIEAVRITGDGPRLDGALHEAVWQQAVPATGFVQREPVEGAPAPEETEVRFAYDDEALWIGARLYSRDPSAIRALITRRDREATSEQLVVSLDTHRDRRTAYSFALTPAGVRIDYLHGSDSEGSRDHGFNPVWEGAAAIDSLGWTAELRIPFTQLRFTPAEMQEWGVNLVRRVPARNEASYWIMVPRDQVGWASRMGTLTGLRGVRTTRRIEVLPYVASDAALAGTVDARDPFARRTETQWRAGADVKMGLGSNVTLDVTLNPDFGQVEADPAEVNLSAFETIFPERRPFFTEGGQLLNSRGLYYSRRVGAAPPGHAGADYAESRSNTTILGAAKLTGRLPSGLSVAAVGAVTGRETVATFDTAAAQRGRAEVAPLAGYFMAGAQQEFGRDRSTIGAMVTAVQRDVDDGSPLAEAVGRSAVSALVDGRWRWAGGAQDLNVYVGGAHVRGTPERILALQRSSRRYWQRPDAGHVSLDPTRASLGGTLFGVGYSKSGGRHWLWDVDYSQESPGLEANDFGSIGAVDRRMLSTNLRYRETQPGRRLRSYEVGVRQHHEWNFDGLRRTSRVEPFANATLPNFWRVSLNGTATARGRSDRLTRGGPEMGTGHGWYARGELRNAGGARTQWRLEASAGGDELGGWRRELETSLSVRPGPQWELSVEPRWTAREEARQWVATVDGGRAATFGRRYVFAHVDRHEISARLRVNYTVTPALSVETYAEPFASSGSYHDFGELEAPGALDLLAYGTRGTTVTVNADGSRTIGADGATFDLRRQDFNRRSFRSNMVLRWEWRLGSTLFVVWQQDRSAALDAARVRPTDVWDVFGGRGSHVLAVKASYWLPVR